MLFCVKQAIRNSKKALSKTFLWDAYHYIKYNILYYAMKKKIGWKSLSNITNDDLNKISYADLEVILQVRGRTAYETVFEKAIQCNLEEIRSRKVKIAFLLYDSSMWIGNDLYWLLKSDERCDVEVILSLRQDQSVTPLILKNHARGLEMFRKNGIYVREDREGKQGDEIEADILIWCDPYYNIRTYKFRASNIPLTKLMVALPYCIFAVRERPLKDIGYSIRYNRSMFHFAWLAFAETRYFQEVIGKYSDAGNSRFFFSGYPKMDAMYPMEEASSFSWKMCAKDAKKIIWSPHWTVNQSSNVSTFLFNYRFFYEYAKEHPLTTSWVIKPHPNLLFSSVCEGGFSNAEEAKEYFGAWDRLPNAKLVLGGDYSDLFKTSDAMINDSLSFMSEYQYVHKPMLYLEREGNDYDFLVKRVLYKTKGNDYEGIEAFINDVVIGGNDSLKEEREEFFEKELDYLKANGVPASVYIYNKIVHEVFGKE